MHTSFNTWEAHTIEEWHQYLKVALQLDPAHPRYAALLNKKAAAGLVKAFQPTA